MEEHASLFDSLNSSYLEDAIKLDLPCTKTKIKKKTSNAEFAYHCFGLRKKLRSNIKISYCKRMKRKTPPLVVNNRHVFSAKKILF